MKDIDRQIQRLKKNPMAVFFASFTSAVVLAWFLKNHIGAVFFLLRDVVNDGACTSRPLQMQGKV